MKKVMEINIYLRHGPGKCYTFQYESQGKRYTFSMKVREFFFQNKVAALQYAYAYLEIKKLSCYITF